MLSTKKSPQSQNVTSKSKSYSEVISTTVKQIPMAVQGYPTQNITFIKNSFDENTHTLVHFIVVNTTIHGYVCDGIHFEIKCHALGSNTLNHSVKSLEVAYPTTSFALYVVPKNESALDVFSVEWPGSSISKHHSTITFSMYDVLLHYSSFKVIGDRLYVTVSEVN
jgi:hypothetical protein